MSSPFPSPSLDQCFVERAEEGGLYESTFAQLRTMSNALANIEYIGTKKRTPNIFRGRDWSRNIVFKDKDDKDGNRKDAMEFKTALIGEICSPDHGTIVRAQGNHYDGREGEPFKPVDDKSKVKDILVLQAPTHCSLEQLNVFQNQTAALQDLENTEHALDAAEGVTPSFRSCLKSKRTDMDSKDLITITTLRKYGIPAAAGGPKLSVTPQKVRRTKRKYAPEDEEEDSDIEPVVNESPANTQPGEVSYPADDAIKLGAFYEPNVLEDHGGPYFQQVNAKLVQLDIRDANNRLIPPWKQYSALRTGSLVLVLATIHMFTFKDPGPDRNRDRKVFQLNAQTIRVLDESDYPVPKRSRPIPRTMLDDMERPSTPGPSSSTASSSKRSFNSFVVTPRSSPSKKTPEDVEMGGEDKGSGESEDKDKGKGKKRKQNGK
ncbi:hypothetical protein C8R47DRAFT_1073164 [Mycena vitilis]|nr:hypothetical protein C8R47DRAFT_1073164 [Mycena vitilis]